MMNGPKSLLQVIVLAAVGVLLYPSGTSAQDPDERAPRRERRRMRSPDRIQERIDRLIEEGVSEDAPRVQRLRRVLERMEEGGWGGDRDGSRDRGRRRRQGRGFGDFGPNQYSPQEIEEFVGQHPELQRLMMMSPDGRDASDDTLRRNLRLSSRQIAEVMTAMDEGQGELADVLIENAKMQFQIRERVRKYHESSEGSSERQFLRDELAGLVRKQVAVDLVVQEYKLRNLRERLTDQEARLAKDRNRQDQLADKRLERLLSQDRERREGWRQPRGFGHRPRNDDRDKQREEDPDL